MNFARLNAFGIPSQVVDCVEGEEPGAPGAGEVLVEILACRTGNWMMRSD